MKRKKSYLLFILGDFKDIKTSLNQIVSTLGFVIGGPYLKYVHHDNLILAHFESYDTLEDIHFYLNTTFDENILSYFLVHKPRKLGMRLDEELEKHLTNLRGNTLKRDEDIVKEKLGENLYHINETLQEYTNQFINKAVNKSTKKTYTLDEVLEKIYDKGIDSLTLDEKKFLDSVSGK